MKNDPQDLARTAALKMAARKAVLPFEFIEEMGLACGYERSFKLLAGRVLANRYLLGIKHRWFGLPAVAYRLPKIGDA